MRWTRPRWTRPRFVTAPRRTRPRFVTGTRRTRTRRTRPAGPDQGSSPGPAAPAETGQGSSPSQGERDESRRVTRTPTATGERVGAPAGRPYATAPERLQQSQTGRRHITKSPCGSAMVTMNSRLVLVTAARTLPADRRATSKFRLETGHSQDRQGAPRALSGTHPRRTSNASTPRSVSTGPAQRLSGSSRDGAPAPRDCRSGTGRALHFDPETCGYGRAHREPRHPRDVAVRPAPPRRNLGGFLQRTATPEPVRSTLASAHSAERTLPLGDQQSPRPGRHCAGDSRARANARHAPPSPLPPDWPACRPPSPQHRRGSRAEPHCRCPRPRGLPIARAAR